MAKEYQHSQYGLANKDKIQYLYTKGYEFSLDGKNYIGEYHKEGTGYWTEPIRSAKSRKLTKYYSDPIVYAYDKARNFQERVRVEPDQSVFKPVETNYESGFATRYFVERAGGYESYPIEIDAPQASLFGKEKVIDEGLYNIVKFPWKLTGYERSYYMNPTTLIEGVFDHNQRQVVQATRVIPNLQYAIKSYTEFARIAIR